MTPADEALARARTLALIAEILLEGWTPRAVDLVRSLPWGAALVDRPADALAARHHAALGRGVSPHASVFASPDGLLGGGEGAWWADWTARTGLAARADVEADHAGRIASALGWLEAARADALRDGLSDRPIRILRDEAVARLGFVPWLAVAVRAQGVPELAEVCSLFADLAADLGAPSAPPGQPEDPLTEEAGLREVAEYLLIPARCGMWLGADDLRRLAVASGVPCGFGRRAQMAESWLISAVDLGALPSVVEALGAELASWDAQLGPDPRRAATSDALARLASAARAASAGR